MKRNKLALVLATALASLACAGATPASAQLATGFNNQSHGNAGPDVSAMIMERVGSDVDRVTISWAQLEPTPGTYRWGGWDSIYNAVVNRGMKPLFILAAAPAWARGNACDGVGGTCVAPPTPEHYEDAGRAAAAIARRYPQAAGIEVWNEPNTPYFWRPRPDPAAYTDLLAQIHGAVKAVDPSMEVVAPGTASGPGSTQSGKISGADFLGAIYLEGGGEYIDAISFHAYLNEANPTVASVLNEVARVRWVRDVLGDPSTPLWITETGVSTSGPHAVDMMRQAQLVLDVDTAIRAEPGVEMLLFHTLVEPNVPASNPERGFGLITAGFWPKPAICVVARVWGALPLC